MKLFSHNIETLRVKHRYRQSDLAKEFGVSQTSYSRWENDGECSFENLVKFSEFYDVSVDDLLKKDLSQPPAKKPMPEIEPGGEESILERGFTPDEMSLIQTLQETLRDQSELIKRLSDQISHLQQQQEQQAQEIHKLKKEKGKTA